MLPFFRSSGAEGAQTWAFPTFTSSQSLGLGFPSTDPINHRVHGRKEVYRKYQVLLSTR